MYSLPLLITSLDAPKAVKMANNGSPSLDEGCAHGIRKYKGGWQTKGAEDNDTSWQADSDAERRSWLDKMAHSEAKDDASGNDMAHGAVRKHIHNREACARPDVFRPLVPDSRSAHMQCV